jgi:flagellar biosynthesis regulator FlbT
MFEETIEKLTAASKKNGFLEAIRFVNSISLDGDQAEFDALERIRDLMEIEYLTRWKGVAA